MQTVKSNGFLIVSLLNKKSFDSVNNFLHRSGHKMLYKRNRKEIVVVHAQKGFKFYDKLMRQKPGFAKEGDDEKI